MGKGYERASEIRSGELAKDKRRRRGGEIGSEKERGAKHGDKVGEEEGQLAKGGLGG